MKQGNFIQLHRHMYGTKIWLSIDSISHIERDAKEYTNIILNNEGGLSVKETPEEILNLINN